MSIGIRPENKKFIFWFVTKKSIYQQLKRFPFWNEKENIDNGLVASGKSSDSVKIIDYFLCNNCENW